MHPMLNIAVRAARSAGNIIVRNLDRLDALTVQTKDRNDFVSEVDRQAEQEILGILRKAYPSHGVLAEESGRQDGNDYLWIIDPLDGTTNFAHNFPWFAVSIALYEQGRSQAGVIYSPMQEELFCGVRGAGAWLNDQPITVSGIAALQEALLATGFPYDVAKRPDSILAVLREVVIRSQGVRRPGAAALDLAYLACGRLDGFWEVGLKPWDTAAGSLLLEEAGGTLSDFRGNPFSPFTPELLASNSLLHEELTTLLARFSSLAP